MSAEGYAVRDGDLYEIQWVEPAPGYEAEGGLIAELYPVEAPFLCPGCERPTTEPPR